MGRNGTAIAGEARNEWARVGVEISEDGPLKIRFHRDGTYSAEDVESVLELLLGKRVVAKEMDGEAVNGNYCGLLEYEPDSCILRRKKLTVGGKFYPMDELFRADGRRHDVVFEERPAAPGGAEAKKAGGWY